jgi:alcohol dehydrogenase class IV
LIDIVERLKNERFDAVIAVGGGSIIDRAKLIFGSTCIAEGLEALVAGRLSSARVGCRLLAIPTTAGTGSEATQFAVLYRNGKKLSVEALELLPSHAVVDPSLVQGVPSRQAAISGFDALTQAIESLWSLRATDGSRQDAWRSIRTIVPVLEKAVNDPDPETCESMAVGAHYSGRAINVSRTTGAHAVSYILTSRFHVPHGHAVALMLMAFFTINQGQQGLSSSARSALAHIKDLYAVFGADDVVTMIAVWRGLMKRCGLEVSLSQLGLPPSCIDDIVGNINVERMGNNPIVCTREMIGEAISEMLFSKASVVGWGNNRLVKGSLK